MPQGAVLCVVVRERGAREGGEVPQGPLEPRAEGARRLDHEDRDPVPTGERVLVVVARRGRQVPLAGEAAERRVGARVAAGLDAQVESQLLLLGVCTAFTSSFM